MTASSFCQVPLMGRFSNTTATTMSTHADAAPPIARVNRACRNLFGSPKPGEIQQKLMLETEKELDKIKELYHIDIRQITAKPLPTLIQEEQDAYEQKLKLREQEEKVEANTVSNINSSANKKTSISSKRSHKFIEINNSDSQKSREKPYDRQSSLTEFCSKRKSTPSSLTVACKQTVSARPTSDATAAANISSQ